MCRLGAYALGLEKQEKTSHLVKQFPTPNTQTHPDRQRISLSKQLIALVYPKVPPHPTNTSGVHPYKIVYKKKHLIIWCRNDTEAAGYAALTMLENLCWRTKRNQIGLYRPDNTILARMAIHQSIEERSPQTWTITVDRNVSENQIPRTISLMTSTQRIRRFY